MKIKEKNKGYRFYRTNDKLNKLELEIIKYAQEYFEKNKPSQNWSNIDFLDLICDQSNRNDGRVDKPLTKDERKLIMTFIQWLGSPVGDKFLSALAIITGKNLTTNPKGLYPIPKECKYRYQEDD